MSITHIIFLKSCQPQIWVTESESKANPEQLMNTQINFNFTY